MFTVADVIKKMLSSHSAANPCKKIEKLLIWKSRSREHGKETQDIPNELADVNFHTCEVHHSNFPSLEVVLALFHSFALKYRIEC